MELDRKELKRAAREAVRMARPRPMVVTLVYGLLIFAAILALWLTPTVGLLAGGAFSPSYELFAWMPFAALFLILLFNAVLGFGYSSYALRLADGEYAGYRELFAGFRYPGRVLLLGLILTGFRLVWSWAVTISAVVVTTLAGSALRYVSEALTSLVMVVGLLGGEAVLLLMLTRYAFADLAMADDPELGAMGAVRFSRALVRGRSVEVLRFYLSFAGWFLLAVGVYMAVSMGGMLLSVLVFGGSRMGALADVCSLLAGAAAAVPLLLWLVPYVKTAAAMYYRVLSGRGGPEPVDAGPEPF